MGRTLLELARDWSAPPLSEGWTELVTASAGALATESAPVVALRAWQQLAMFFGDTRAPELCALVALHALTLPADDADKECARLASMLHSHARLALLDLGIAHSGGGPIPLAAIEDAVSVDASEVGRWLRNFIEPIGRLRDAAPLCLRLAAIRAQLAPRPEPFTLEAVAATALSSS